MTKKRTKSVRRSTRKSTRHSQFGRSMVEIIAVLILMGILSVTGLYGYQFAMEKNRENESVDQIVKAAVAMRTGLITQKYADTTNPIRPDGRTKVAVVEYMSNVPSNTYDFKTPDGTEVSVDVTNAYSFEINLKNMTPGMCKTLLRSDVLNLVRWVDEEIWESEDISQAKIDEMCAQPNLVVASCPDAKPYAPVYISEGDSGTVAIVCGECFDDVSTNGRNYHAPFQKSDGSWECCPTSKTIAGGVCCDNKNLCGIGCCEWECSEDQLGTGKTACCSPGTYNFGGKCLPCVSDADCDGLFCDSNHECRICLSNYNSGKRGPCPENTPVCDTASAGATYTCGECAQGVYDASVAACVTCFVDADGESVGCGVGSVCDTDVSGGQCVACVNDANVPNRGCGASNPYCFTKDGVNGCYECDSDADCTDAPNYACNTTTHMCVPCADVYADKPVYNATLGCVECNTNNDCAGNTDGRLTCIPATGNCVTCPTGITDDNGNCVNCKVTSATTHPGCNSTEKYCNVNKTANGRVGVCQACTSALHCANHHYCTAAGTCSPCGADQVRTGTQTTCQNCGTNKTRSGDTCVCKPGYYGTNCTECTQDSHCTDKRKGCVGGVCKTKDSCQFKDSSWKYCSNPGSGWYWKCHTLKTFTGNFNGSSKTNVPRGTWLTTKVSGTVTKDVNKHSDGEPSVECTPFR